MEEKGCKHVFIEYANTGFLKKESKRLMIRTATDYLVTTFSLYPQYQEISNVCLAIIEWFPAYSTSNSKIGGIVSDLIFFMSGKLIFLINLCNIFSGSPL